MSEVLTCRTRPESGCGACPRLVTTYVPPVEVQRGNRYGQGAPADIVFVMMQPDVDRDRSGAPVSLPGIPGATRSVFQRALRVLGTEDGERFKSSVVALFAAACTPIADRDKPRAGVLAQCQPHVRRQIEALAPSLVVAFGSEALKQVGVARKHADVRGRVLESHETGLPEGTGLLVTFSDAAVAAAPGLYRTFEQDLRNGFRWLAEGATGVEDYAQSRRQTLDAKFQTITAGHRIPGTIDEAIALCDEIVAHVEVLPDGKRGPGTIAIDTETSSLHADKEGARLIAFCFSWGEGLSTAFMFDHPFAPPEWLSRLDELRAAVLRVLTCPKPKVFHNFKFDLKWVELAYQMPVANVAWCSLCGEHLLDEDKKGHYGLKSLTTAWLPDLSGYEDRLDEHVPQRADENEAQWARTMADHPLAQEREGLREALLEHATRIEAYIAAKERYAEAQAAYKQELAAWRGRRAEYLALKAAHVALRAAAPRPRKPAAPTLLSSDADRQRYVLELQAYDAAKAEYDRVRAIEPPTFDEKAPTAPSRADLGAARAPDPPDLPADLEGAVKASQDAGYEYIPPDILCQYGAIDTDVTRRLTRLQGGALLREAAKYRAINPQLFRKGPYSLMASHVIPASRALGRMEFTGIRIDLEYADRLQDALTKIIDAAKKDVATCAAAYRGPRGEAFSPSSSTHLADVLYVQGWVHPDGGYVSPVPCLEYTTLTQKMSTTKKALAPYLKYDEVPDETNPGKKKLVARRESFFVDRVSLYKKATKARDTFLLNVRALSARDGRIHTGFHIPGTGTGRLSSSAPNLQNIPSKLAGWSIKKLFVPDTDDFVLVNWDWKGAEVRVFTVYAADPGLIEALNSGMDMHSFFASRVFRNPYEDYQRRDSEEAFPASEMFEAHVDGSVRMLNGAQYRALLDKQRQQIKRVVFGILYGAGPVTIAEQCGCTLEEAKEVIALLFTMFPSIKAYLDNKKLEVEKYGAVETVFGRMRRFPLAGSSRHAARAVRQASNFCIQSTSSDIVMAQLVEITEVILSDQTWPDWGIHEPLHALGVKVFLTVHDSIVFQWPKKLLNALTPWITYYGETRVREKYPWLPVPFSGDISVGDSYGEQMSVQKYLAKLPPDYFEIEQREEDFEAEVVLRKDAFEE